MVDTPQKEEHSHHESEEKFAKAFRCSPQPFTLSTLKEDRYIEVNDAFELKTGYRREEVIGRTVGELGIWVDYAERGKLVEKILRGERIRNVECHFRKKTGEVFIDLLSAELLDLGGVMCVVANVIDITDWRRTEEALRATEKRAALYLQQTMLGIIEWDRDFRVVEWNPAAESIFGYSRSDTLGHACELIVPARTVPEMRSVFETALKRSGGELSVHENIRKKGDTITCEWFNTSLIGENGAVIGIVSLVHDVTERKRAEEALSVVGQKLIEAHEEERTWIARELHDDISQRLALLTINLERLQHDPPSSIAEVMQEIGQASKQLEDLGSDVQALSHRLHSSKLEYLGLTVAAAGFCREFAERQGVQIDFSSENVPRDLSQEISICLFRVLQEAVQNAAKYSGSRHFQVSLSSGSSEIALTVRDSGIGFDPEKTVKGQGLGLTSIAERLKLVNGELSIDSRLQHGTTIQARVPLNPRMKSTGTAG